MGTEDEVTQSVADVLTKHNVHLHEVAYSTALFLLASPDGESISSRVAKWFHPDEGERFFAFRLDQETVEYFAVVLFEGQNAAQVVSFGIVHEHNACYDIFSFRLRHPNVPTIDSHQGYIVEIACIETNKTTNLFDYSEAKHIHGKYMQRNKNLTHYYPQRQLQSPSSFLTVERHVPGASNPQAWDFFAAQRSLQTKQHSWDLAFASPADFHRAYQELLRDASSAQLVGGRNLQTAEPLKQTNKWGCLLYDIVAQSLTSASIPKTRLYVPWVLTSDARQFLSLKIVV